MKRYVELEISLEGDREINVIICGDNSQVGIIKREDRIWLRFGVGKHYWIRNNKKVIKEQIQELKNDICSLQNYLHKEENRNKIRLIMLDTLKSAGVDIIKANEYFLEAMNILDKNNKEIPEALDKTLEYLDNIILVDLKKGEGLSN